MGLIYKPFGILLGILAGILGRRLFTLVWEKIDDEEPPEPTTEEASWRAGHGRRGASGRDLPRHPCRRRPLRSDRLALSHGDVAGGEAPGPRMTKPRSAKVASEFSNAAKSRASS